MKIKYGDRLSLALTPRLEMEISQALEEWLMELSDAEEFDLDTAEFEGMKKVIRVLVKESDKSSKLSANSPTDDAPF